MKEKDPNKFMKILIACGVTYEQMRDYNWEVTQLELHKYRCDGVHPVAARISIKKDNVVIH